MQNKLDQYLKHEVETASPGKLILMLFDGALRFIQIAKVNLEDTEPSAKRNEQIHNNIIKTSNILLELQGSLDLDKGGEFAKTMYGLYGYMQKQLNVANVQKSLPPLLEVESHLKPIRDAWAEMLIQNSAQDKPTKPTQFSHTA